jgi:hypothetical protein
MLSAVGDSFISSSMGLFLVSSEVAFKQSYILRIAFKLC